MSDTILINFDFNTFYSNVNTTVDCQGKNCITMMISIITIQVDCRFWYKWVYFFLPSALGNTRRETQFIRAYANHTMLTPTPQHAWCTLVSSRLQLISGGWDPNWSDPITSKKLNCFLRWQCLDCFFLILKFSGYLFWVWCHPPTQFTPTVHPDPFPVWEFIMIDDCHILSDYNTWIKRHWIVQSLTKLNNKIYLMKMINIIHHYLDYITKFIKRIFFVTDLKTI